jgi:hypothetical protein
MLKKEILKKKEKKNEDNFKLYDFIIKEYEQL